MLARAVAPQISVGSDHPSPCVATTPRLTSAAPRACEGLLP